MKSVRIGQFSRNASNGHYIDQIEKSIDQNRTLTIQDQLYHEISQASNFGDLTEAQQERLQREKIRETKPYQACPALV